MKSRLSAGDDVLKALMNQCEAMSPGERIPTHTELMRSLSASERAVREALSVLQRDGWIVRKNGVGTFVADLSQLRLRRANPTIIGIARPDRSFFDRCIEVMYRRCEEAGLTLLCQPIESRDGGLRVMPSITNEVIGYVVFGYSLAPIAKQLQNEGARVVVIGTPRVDVQPEVPTIYNDSDYGGYLAASHLIELGHRRIAFCQAGTIDLQHQQRWQGHQRALGEAVRKGIPVEGSLLPEEETIAWDWDQERAKRYFLQPDAATGIVMWNDYEASKLLSTLTRAGIRVPEDVSLIGYDALPDLGLMSPSLTTVDHNIQYQVRTSVDLLVRSNPLPATHTVVVVPNLVIRESTARPRQ